MTKSVVSRLRLGRGRLQTLSGNNSIASQQQTHSPPTQVKHFEAQGRLRFFGVVNPP